MSKEGYLTKIIKLISKIKKYSPNLPDEPRWWEAIIMMVVVLTCWVIITDYILIPALKFSFDFLHPLIKVIKKFSPNIVVVLSIVCCVLVSKIRKLKKELKMYGGRVSDSQRLASYIKEKLK